MNPKLLRTCFLLWAVGLAGMWVSRVWLDLDPQGLPFQLAARLFFVGGAGYTSLGILGLMCASRTLSRHESGPGADLSAWIRRR